MPAQSSNLRFPTVENVDYFDVVKNKQTLTTYKKKDIEGRSWRDVQLMIGSQFGAGVYFYNFKQNGIDYINRGQIRGVATGVQLVQKENKTDMTHELENIKAQIKNIGQSNGVSVDLLISITKQSYQMQINFLNDELRRKQNQIDKLEKQIDDLNEDLNNADEQIEDLKSKTGINQYLNLAQDFLKLKTGKAAPLATLKDSDPADIPAEILNILGAVDWSKVSPEILKTIVMYLNMYIDKLPLKG